MNNRHKTVALVHLAHWEQLLGGAEQQLKYLSELLFSNGYEVHIIYLDRTVKKIKSKDIIRNPIKHIRLPGRFGKYWFIYKNRLLKSIKKIDPDVLITRTRSSWAGIVSEYAEEYGKKHIHYLASDNDVDLSKLEKYRVFDAVEWIFYRKVFGGASQIVCQNHLQASEIFRFFNINASVQTQMAPAPEESSVEKKSLEVITIVWVANLKSLKRPEKFIQLAEMFKGNRRFRFIMIGGDKEGNYHQLLSEAKKMNNFIYKGLCSNEDVNKELELAHILVNTSDYEGFSNTFVQAWLRGVFVMSLNSDPDMIMQKNEVGKKLESIEAIAEEIRTFSLNARDILGNASRIEQYALENHTIETVYSDDFQ